MGWRVPCHWGIQAGTSLGWGEGISASKEVSCSRMQLESHQLALSSEEVSLNLGPRVPVSDCRHRGDILCFSFLVNQVSQTRKQKMIRNLTSLSPFTFPSLPSSFLHFICFLCQWTNCSKRTDIWLWKGRLFYTWVYISPMRELLRLNILRIWLWRKRAGQFGGLSWANRFVRRKMKFSFMSGAKDLKTHSFGTQIWHLEQESPARLSVQ